MSRKPIIQQSEFPYHVSGRCINKEWFSIPLDEVWSIMEMHLHFISSAYGIKIHAFTLMSNHFHLLVSTPKANLSEAIAYFMKETTRSINRITGRSNQAWGGRFIRSLICSQHYFLHCYKYIYRNPVEAGICQKVLDYPFTTLKGLVGDLPLFIPIHDDTLFEMGAEGCCAWLDTPVSKENWLAVKCALSKAKFKLPHEKYSNRPSELELDML